MEEAFDYLDAPVTRVAGLDCHIPFSLPLEKAMIPNIQTIVEAVRSTVNRDWLA
jgi:pyruvate dehydrogenase E1 component beta subunit